MKIALEEKRQSPTDFYDCLVKKHYDSVLGYIQCRMADKDRARDVTQETFLAAWTRVSELYEHPNIRAWLLRTAQYKMKHLFQDDKNENAAISSAIEGYTGESIHEQDTTDLLESLNDQDSAVLLMHYEEGMSIAEIAKALGSTQDAAKMRLSRARRKLTHFAKKKNFLKYFLIVCYLLMFSRDI